MIVRIKEGGELFWYNAKSIEDAKNKHIENSDGYIKIEDIDSAIEISRQRAAETEVYEEDYAIGKSLLDLSILSKDKTELLASTIF